LNSGPLVPQTPPAAKYEIAEFVFDPWRAPANSLRSYESAAST